MFFERLREEGQNKGMMMVSFSSSEEEEEEESASMINNVHHPRHAPSFCHTFYSSLQLEFVPLQFNQLIQEAWDQDADGIKQYFRKNLSLEDIEDEKEEWLSMAAPAGTFKRGFHGNFEVDDEPLGEATLPKTIAQWLRAAGGESSSQGKPQLNLPPGPWDHVGAGRSYWREVASRRGATAT